MEWNFGTVIVDGIAVDTAREKRLQDWAHEKLREWGLGDWTFSWDNGKVRFGVCRYRRKEISVSRPLTHLNSDDEIVKDVILHEIAHALTPGANHNWVWKNACRRVGAKPEVTYDGEQVNGVEYKWIGTCPNGHSIGRHRLTDNSRYRIACSECCDRYNGGRFDPRFRFNWEEQK